MTQYEMIVGYLTALAGRFRDDERGIGVAETIVLTGFALVGDGRHRRHPVGQAQGRRRRRRRAGAAGPVASAGSWQRCCSGSAETIEAGSPPRSSCSRCSPSIAFVFVQAMLWQRDRDLAAAAADRASSAIALYDAGDERSTGRPRERSALARAAQHLGVGEPGRRRHRRRGQR